MTDIGVSCQKDSYGRGVGIPLQCKQDEQEQAGLCYPFCKDKYNGDGPVCWATCPKGMFDCSALCTLTKEACNDSLQKEIADCTTLAAAIAEAAITGDFDIVQIIKDLGIVALDFAKGICYV